MKCASIAPLLCLATILLVQASYELFRGGFAADEWSDCPCPMVSRGNLHITDVINYKIMRPRVTRCHMVVVGFIKKNRDIVCGDPRDPWVRRVMLYLDKRKLVAIAKKEKVTSTSAYMGSGNIPGDLRTTTTELYVNIVTGRSLCPCLKTSDIALPEEDIRSYKIHDVDVCPIHTIEFETVQGFTFCSNPQKPWVKRAMQLMDEKMMSDQTTANSLNEVESTSPELFKKITICL